MLLFICYQFIAVTTILDYDKIVIIAKLIVPENKNRKYFNYILGGKRTRERGTKGLAQRVVILYISDFSGHSTLLYFDIRSYLWH